MTTPSGDHNDAYFDAMHAKITEREGQILYAATSAIFDADGFAWRDDDTRTAIAYSFRHLGEADGFADALTQIICAVYAGRDFPHDPDAVRRAVVRQLGDAHGTSIR